MPGSTAMCSWHFSAVALRYGSIAMSRAPRRLASCARVQKCRLDAMGLLPQIRMSLLSRIARGPCRSQRRYRALSPPCRRPRRSCGRAAMRPGDGRSAGPCRRLQQAHGARVAVRQDRLRPAARDRREARASSSASSHEIRSKRPSPFAADAPHRMQQPVRVIRRARDSARPSCTARPAWADGRARRDLDGAPVLDRHEHRAGIGAVVRARAAHEISRSIHRRSVTEY